MEKYSHDETMGYQYFPDLVSCETAERFEGSAPRGDTPFRSRRGGSHRVERGLPSHSRRNRAFRGENEPISWNDQENYGRDAKPGVITR